MAVDLNAEVKRQLIADALTNGGDETDSTDESPEETDSTDSTEQPDSGKEPTAPPQPAASPSRQEAGFFSFADYTAAASPTPPPPTAAAAPAAQITYPTIAEDQTGAPPVATPATAQPEAAPAAAQPAVPAGHIDLGPPGGNIYTDTDTGGRYVIDPNSGQMVPHAELATAADKAAQPAGGVELPKQTVTGVGWSPEEGLPVPQDQVRRAQLVKLPQAAQPAPDRLDQVERGELVKLPTQPAPDTLTQVEKGQLIAPKVQPAQPVTGAPQPAAQAPATQQPPTQASARQAAGFLSFSDYSAPKPPAAQQPGAQQPATPGQVPAEPQIDIQAQSYTKGRTQEPNKLILHSSDGTSVQGDINTLTGAEAGHRVSANYYVTRDGTVHHLVAEGDTAWHAGADRYGGNGNAYTLGIEQQHVDGRQDWPDAQVRATAGVAAGILARHPNMTIDDVIGHSDLAGERKQDPVDYPWPKFRQYVAEAQGQQGTGTQAAAPSAQPVTKLKSGFYQDEKPSDFLTGKATTFATPDDIATGQDNGRGAPKLGAVDTTQVAGLAIPQSALEQMFGRDWAAAARQARVDVVDQATGKRLRVPIVDLGPRGDLSAITDQTPALANLFGGGDRNLSIKIVPKAGPDVMKNPQLFYDEQAAIKNGFDSSTLDPKRQVIAPGGTRFATVAQTPEEATAAQQKVQAAMQSQQAALAKLPEYGDNDKAVALYKRLDDPVPGVSDPMRLAYQAQVKAEITKYAQDVYGEKDPDAAFTRATADANFGTVAAEAGHHFMGYLGQADVGLNQLGQMGDTNRLSTFAKLLHPENNPQQNQAFIKSITTDIPDVNLRDRTIGILFSQLEPAKQQMMNSTDIVDAADRVADPAYQKAQQEAIDKKTAWTEGQLKADPQLRGTLAEKAADLGGQFGANALLAFAPPGIRESALGGQVAAMTRADLKQAHPEWSAAELAKHTEDSTALQLVPQEILTLAVGHQLGSMVANLQGPVSRIAATALTHLGIGATAGTAQQIGANIGAGRPIMTGVPEAAVTGAIMTAPSAAMAGVHAAFHPPEERAAVEQPPVQPTEERPPLQPPTEETRPVQPPVQPPVEPPIRPTEEALNREEPIAPEEKARPQVEEQLRPEVDEEQLNQRNRDLYDRYKLEGQLPIEEKPISADITESERQQKPVLPESLSGTEEGVRRESEPVREDLGAGLERGDIGPVVPERGQVVPPELERVQKPLEVSLSPEERARYQPELDAYTKLDYTSPEGQSAFDNLLNRIYTEKFEPLYRAGGIERVEDPNVASFAAGQRAGEPKLLINSRGANEYTADVQRQGGDPIAYLHNVLQEELIHHAQNFELKDQWQNSDARKAGVNYADWLSRHAAGIFNELDLAGQAARAKGNRALANEIDNIWGHSAGLYQIGVDPEVGKSNVEHTLKRLKDPDPTTRALAGIDLSNHLHEFTRQMLQLKHGDPTESHFRNAVNAAIEFYQRAVAGLKRIYKALKPGNVLAKTELAKLVNGIQRRLQVLEQKARTGDVAAPRAPEEGGAGDIAGPKLSEALRRLKTWHSMALKGGESSMMDYDEARPLGLAIRRKQGYLQRFGQQGRLTQLEDAFRAVKPGDRARVKDEFTRYITAEQNKQPLPAVGADTMRVINAGKDTLQQMGQIAKSLDLHVRQSDGKVRPMQLIGRNYYPRMISRDTMDIFNQRDGARKADFDALVNRQIARGVVKDRQEFIDKFTHSFSGDMSSNEHFSNLEKAREQQLPNDFYDFGPEALLRYATRSRDRLAQAAAYGQKLSNEGKDMFDHTIEEVNNSGNLSQEQKQMIVTRINQERQAEYQQAFRNNFDKISSLVRGAATGAFVGNPLSALRYVITGQAQNLVYGGPGTFGRTFARFLNVPKMMDAMKEVRERNMVRANMADLYHDFDLTTNQGWATKGVQGFTKQMLEWGGHNIADSFNRAVGMQQGKFLLENFAKNWKSGKDTAATRSLYDMIARRGISRNDFDALAKENGNGPLTDEFLRQYVMDVHGNYSPAQNAAHLFDNPAGKMLLQFQKWGNNSFRMATREFFMPLARAAAERKPADFAYQLARNVGMIAAATGTGMSIQMVTNWLKGRDPNDPSVQDIYTRFAHGDGARALELALTRAWGAIHISGFLGILDNYMDLARQATGEAPGPTTKDPMHPPGESLLQPFMSLIQGWRGEGGAVPSPELIDQFAGSILSQYRVAKQLNDGFARVSGLHTPFSEEQLAQNDQSFLRSRVKMYEDENPVIQQKFAEKGRAQPPMAQRSEFSPFRDQIHAALLSGNEAKAVSVIRSWLDRFPPEEQKAQIKGLKIGIQASSPIKAGGSTSADSTLEFLDWAKKNLPEGEARKIFALSQTYAKTALATGIEGNSKTMNKLANSTYDNYRPAAVMSQAKAAVQGRASMQQLIQRQRIANQLLNR